MKYALDYGDVEEFTFLLSGGKNRPLREHKPTTAMNT